MRLILALSLSVLLVACSQSRIESPEAPPPTSASVYVTGEPGGVCGDVAYVAVPTARQNASLAGDFYRQAQTATTPEGTREAFCSASVYLRWLLANDPTFTGSDPDDRHFRRMADAHEFFAGLPEADRRAHLDSALALRAEADALRRDLALPFDAWASSLREGVFYGTHADAFEDASRRQFDAFDEAFRASPESIDDGYLRRLVELSAEFFETCETRADYLTRLADHVDDAQLREYVEAVAACAPVLGERRADVIARLVGEYQDGDLLDCEPAPNVRALVAAAAQAPDLVTEAGGDPEAIMDSLLDCVAEPNTAAQAFALFRRAWTRGDRDLAETYFQTALDLADFDGQRGDFYYSRVNGRLGDVEALIEQGLAIAPAHGPLLYTRASRLAQSIGRPEGVTARAAYWCLADAFREVAASGDPRVTANARRAVQGYERAAPTREQYIFSTDWTPGTVIQARSGGVTCTTRVR